MSNAPSAPAGSGQTGSARLARSRSSRALAVVLVLVAGLYLAVTIGARQTPRLGLDLRGGTSVVLTATAEGITVLSGIR